MRKNIRLFINNKEVEFVEKPEILYNYVETDFSNPAIVKNSFSKTITIEGTSVNNDIFGHIWDLERIQVYSSGSYSGVYFNPLDKADFALYVNEELYESGYIKLDEIVKKGASIEYSITLYGGLGNFFYNLMYADNDSVSDSPDKLRLCDLSFATDEESEPELSFSINKDTVKEAWDNLYSSSGKWSIINFAPCYNGLPNDFDDGRCLVNSNNMQTGDTYFTFEESGYTTVGGYSLGEMSTEMTEWETRDLRSYLQRPIIRMKAIIDACCNPVNNGGYEVKLDSHFFNKEYDNRNPYYDDAWLTLPMLRDLSKGNESITASTADLVELREHNYLVQTPSGETFTEYSNVNFGLLVKFNPTELDDTLNELFLSSVYENASYGTLNGRVKYFNDNAALLAQVIALDGAGIEVGASNIYYLSTINNELSTDFNNYKAAFNAAGANVSMPLKNVQGRFLLKDNAYYFCDMNGSEIALGFKLNTQTEFFRLKLVIYPISKFEEKIFKHHSSGLNFGIKDIDCLYQKTSFVGRNLTLEDVYKYLGKQNGTWDYEIVDFNMIGKSIEDLFSNTIITKEDLLSNDITPCDYLLSYCKLFNLYFYKDSKEQSDKENCPSGVIHIMDRDSFYKRDKIVNLNELIDRDKEIKITPQIPETKWYDFNVEEVESEVNSEYNNKYGYDFGLKRINTGYNFDNEKTVLLEDDVVFKSAVDVLEESRYYQQSISDLPVYVWDNFTYNLYKQNGDSYEPLNKAFTTLALYKRSINPSGLNNTDAFPKIQLHAENNDPSDGENVLLFFRGEVTTKVDAEYWLTDDVEEMISLNDSTPCWIMTASEYDVNDNRIAYKLDTLPYFSRNIVYGNNIIRTWDYGVPKTTFVANTFVSSAMTIYDRCWKDYFEDMYSVDSRKLTCYCYLNEQPNPEWMRQFYYFDNSYWRLNAIKDWDLSSDDTTLMEFVKVRDINNYALKQLTEYGDVEVYIDNDTVGYEGGNVVGRIYVQDGGNWYLNETSTCFVDGEEIEYETTEIANVVSGEGNTEIIFTIPENDSDFLKKWIIPLSPTYPKFQNLSFIIYQKPKPLITRTNVDIPIFEKPNNPEKPIKPGINNIDEPIVEPDVEDSVIEPVIKEPIVNNTVVDNTPTAYWVNREPPASVNSKNSMSAQLFNLYGEEGWVTLY